MSDSAHTVYVVDDDAGMLESTQWLLESVGLHVQPYADGRQFLNAVNPEHTGCVVLDIRMPGLGGLNATSYHLSLWPRGCPHRGPRLQIRGV